MAFLETQAQEQDAVGRALVGRPDHHLALSHEFVQARQQEIAGEPPPGQSAGRTVEREVHGQRVVTVVAKIHDDGDPGLLSAVHQRGEPGRKGPGVAGHVDRSSSQAHGGRIRVLVADVRPEGRGLRRGGPQQGDDAGEPTAERGQDEHGNSGCEGEEDSRFLTVEQCADTRLRVSYARRRPSTGEAPLPLAGETSHRRSLPPSTAPAPPILCPWISTYPRMRTVPGTGPGSGACSTRRHRRSHAGSA